MWSETSSEITTYDAYLKEPCVPDIAFTSGCALGRNYFFNLIDSSMYPFYSYNFPYVADKLNLTNGQQYNYNLWKQSSWNGTWAGIDKGG